MTVGTLGDIAFEVTSDTIMTVSNFEWSGSAQWAVHNRHLGHALTEFTGLAPDEISFDIYISAYLGKNPMEELTRIWELERNGTPVPLTMGEHKYGKGLWVVQSHTVKAETTDREGDITGCTVSVKLLEYLKE